MARTATQKHRCFPTHLPRRRVVAQQFADGNGNGGCAAGDLVSVVVSAGARGVDPSQVGDTAHRQEAQGLLADRSGEESAASAERGMASVHQGRQFDPERMQS